MAGALNGSGAEPVDAGLAGGTVLLMGVGSGRVRLAAFLRVDDDAVDAGGCDDGVLCLDVLGEEAAVRGVDAADVDLFGFAWYTVGLDEPGKGKTLLYISVHLPPRRGDRATDHDRR